MHKAKILMPVLALALIVGLSGTAEAAISCNVASTPVSRATASGHTEPAGELTFICTGSAGATTTATVTIDYGVTITNTQAWPAGAGIGITNPSGFFAAGVSVISVSNTSGQVILQLPGVAAPTGLSGQFTLSGVLVSLAGAAGSNLTANVSVSPGNQYFITAGQNNATVITTILPGLASLSTSFAGSSGTGTTFTNGQTSDGIFSFRVTENYIDMLRSMAQFNAGGSTRSTDVLLTFAGIPTGASINACSVVNTGVASAVFTYSSGTTITATNNTAIVSFGTSLDLTNVDSFTVTCGTGNTNTTAGFRTGTATIPLAGGTITVDTTLVTGNALGTNNAPLVSTATGGHIPRYAETLLGAITVVNIVPATTNLLVPFAMVNSGIDTGLSIANTSLDPYGTSNGGASAVSGPLTFHFYQDDGTTATYTTVAGSPGIGLNNGSLDGGTNYTVNVSELLAVATPAVTGSFTGYIFVVAEFTHGHGGAFVVDWSGATNFTSATNVLAVPPPSLSQRTLGAGANLAFVESLGN